MNLTGLIASSGRAAFQQQPCMHPSCSRSGDDLRQLRMFQHVEAEDADWRGDIAIVRRQADACGEIC